MSADEDSLREFGELMALPDEQIPLDRAALLIAQAEYPALEVQVYLDRLNGMASEIRPRLSPEERPERLVAELNAYLFGEESFHGNAADYYDPRNSYLNDVLDRRTGIPITLSLLYMELGRRLGLEIEGIGLPGHFIIRCPSERGGILVDPFGQGEVLTIEDCRRRVREMYGQSLEFGPELLRAAGPREIVVRMLSNLKGAYLRRGDLRRALRAAEWAVIAEPGQLPALRELGLLRYRGADFRGAIRDLSRFLELAEDSPPVETTRGQLLQIEELWTRRN